MNTDRCHNCDRPHAKENRHKGGCECPACVSVCWSKWGTTCPSVDWRERALRAEARLRELGEEVAT